MKPHNSRLLQCDYHRTLPPSPRHPPYVLDGPQYGLREVDGQLGVEVDTAPLDGGVALHREEYVEVASRATGRGGREREVEGGEGGRSDTCRQTRQLVHLREEGAVIVFSPDF